MSDWATDDATPEPDGDSAEAGPDLVYGNVDEFVREHLRRVYRRPIDGYHRVWAARWWEHDEAVDRLTALWRAWEKLHHDRHTGLSLWWRDHADHHLPILLSPDGPFAAADPTDPANHTTTGQPLPYTPPPPGLFPDERHTGERGSADA